MPRSIDVTAQSPHSLERIGAAFESEAYWRFRLSAFEVGAPVLDHLAIDPSGQISVSVTMRFSHDQLPDVLRRLRLPVLEVVQREQWTPVASGVMRGDVRVHARKTPISGRGSVQLTPAGAGTRLAGTATVDVKLPLVGGPISHFVVGLLADGILDIVNVTDAWLVENP